MFVSVTLELVCRELQCDAGCDVFRAGSNKILKAWDSVWRPLLAMSHKRCASLTDNLTENVSVRMGTGLDFGIGVVLVEMCVCDVVGVPGVYVPVIRYASLVER